MRSLLSRSRVHLRQGLEALFQVFVGGDEVAHLAVVELLVGVHVEVAGAGQAEEDGLLLAGFAAPDGLVHGDLDGVAAFRRGQDALDAREGLGGLEHVRLHDGARLDQSLIVQLGQNAAHAVIAQAAGVVRRGNEAAAQRVHLLKRAHAAGVAVVVGVHAAGEAGAGRGLDGDELIVLLAAQLFAHERGNQAAQIGAAAGAANDDVRLDAVFVHSRLALKADYGLMQKHLTQNAAQHVAVALVCGRVLNGFGNRAAKASAGAGMLLQNLAADVRRLRRRGRYLRAVGAHDLAAERLLLIGYLHHVHVAVQPQIRARHGQRRAPLARAGLGGHALQTLILGVVRLRDGGIQLVAAAGVVALKFVINFRRRVQLLFKAVRARQRRGTVHLVEVQNFLRNRNFARVVVQLLLHELLAEHVLQLLGGHGLQRLRVQQRRGLFLHIRAHIVPIFRHLIFGQIDFVRDFLLAHGFLSFPNSTSGTEKSPVPEQLSCWDRGMKILLLRCHPA